MSQIWRNDHNVINLPSVFAKCHTHSLFEVGPRYLIGQLIAKAKFMGVVNPLCDPQACVFTIHWLRVFIADCKKIQVSSTLH